MASGGADEEDEGISLDIDDVHMLLHVEQEQIQKRTFTNWINAQLAKRSPTSHVSDLFSDLRDGSVLLDLLEVITGRPMKRQKGHGVFQQRADIETALDFLRKKSIKLVNINIPDIIDGNPSIILGLIWTIILHCHIEEMTSSLSNSIPHSSLDSLDSVESSSSTPPSASPVPPGQRSLHKSFGLSAKKALLTWAQDQCQRVGCPVSIKDFKSSWQSGEAFLAILCSLRPQLVDLSRVRSRSHLENLQEAFELAERELHIPHLLEPQDVDVPDPDEKSIMTFVAQFLQFSIDLSSPNAHEKEPVLPSAAFKDDNRPTSPTSLHQGNKQHKTSSEGQTEAKKAKSQLEKTRIRLQARIQQATKLFSSKEISEAEAKRKERALRALKPALLEDFLAAVECFGAFCAEPQLQDLILLSNSVRKQWEDVRTEMAAYIPMLWSKIRDRKQQVSVLSSEIYTNTLHKATDLSDHGDWHQQQVFTEGALSSEKSVQPLESSPLTTDKIPQATVMEQTADGATLLTIDSPLRTTGMRITTSPRNKLVLNQPPVDCLQEEPSPVSPVEVSPQLFANMVPLQAQAVPPEAEDNPRPIEEHSRPEQDFVPEELPLVTCIWHDSQGKHQIQEQDSVWTRREREWSGIVGTTNPQQKLDTIREEVVLSFSEAIDPMESVDDDIMLISENINQIAITPINISSLTLTDPTLLSDLKDINNRLQAKMEQLLDHKHKTPQAISSHSDTLHSSVHHRRQYLEQVLSAVQDLDLFLATLRKVKAESSNVLVKQDDSEWQCVADREVEIQQRFESSFRQSENTDSALNAVGLRLTMDGANVTCRDVVTLLFKDIEEELTQKRNVEVIEERQQVQENRSKNVIEKMNANVFEQTEAQGCPTNSLERIKDFKLMGNEEVVKTRDEKKRRRRPSEVEVEEESLDQRRIKLLGELKELRTEAEELGLQEHTLPALHQRSRALMRLENCLSDLQSELEHIQKASQSENCDDNVNREVEDLWEATTKAVSDRLEQCHLLAELLKRFQKIRGEVGETLLRAETTVRDQASYMGREKLQRLQTKVNETKTELNNLGDRIEELRSVSRQLCTHLHKIQQCTSNIPFESEAHSLMDQWLDISERVESRVENLHLAFSLWDSALKQGLEVERWAMNKLSAFAHSPTFQTEEDIKALQDEVEAQEESMKCFQQITIDIQELLQSTEPPLELQVVEPQMRRKMDELKELVSEAEDVYRQTEAAKTNVTDRMTASFSSLHNIYESLLSLRGPDPAAVLAKLKDLCFQLQDQDEQVQSLQEDLQVLASVARPESLQSLFDNGQKLQDGIRTVHQLFSAVEERMQRDIQVYDRLQQEQEHLKQWLNNAEYKVSEDLSVLQEEVLNQRVRTEALSQLLLLLRNSTFQQTELIEDSGKLLERYNSFETGVQGGLGEKQNREKLSESLSTQTCVKEVKQPDAPISENCGVRRGLCAESSAAKDRQTCATGSIDDLKHEVQESEKEMQGEDVPQTLQPGQIDLQTSDHPSSASTFSQSFMSSVPSLTDDMRKDRILKDSHWFELETCLSLLKAQLDDVSSPGEAVCNEERFSRLLQDCCHELTSLQGKMSDCQDENTATPSSYSALEVLLQQLADIDKDLSQLVAPMDLTSSLSQQINNLLNHKRALHNSIRERMAHDKKQSNQQVEEDAVNGVSKDTDRSILEPKHRDCAENALRETGVTQVKSQLQQRRQTEYMGPPAPSPLSFGLDETILDHKEDDIFSSLSAFQHKITDVVPSHCQPFHCPQNDSTIVIKGSFISEEKPPAWFLPVTETSGETNVIENGPNQRPQGETLVPCPGDIQITNAIVQDSNTEIIVTSPSYSGDSEIYAKCQASAKEATAQDFKQKDDTDFCQLEELMMGRVLRTVEGEDLTNKKLSMAAEDTHAYPVEMEEEDGNVDQANDTESKEKQCLDSIALLLKKVCKLEFPPSSEDTEMTPGQITLDMEPERTHGSDAHRGAGEATGGSYKHKFTMRDILAGVQSLVESSTIINRAPRLDLNWFLKSSPSEAEIHLIRTVQRVFVCRYQPAQLSLTAMTRQLQDAENYRCCVQEQVAAIKSTGKSDIPKSLEGLCSAALLDASATVQVKEAQLEQVKQYHRQVKMIKTFLEVVAAERDKMSLDILGSSELQAVQLHALLKTMDQKRCLINELVKLSGQLSVHLSNTESLGALVARLGDVQEEWRLLEGCIKTDLQHASNSASQLSAFRQESNALKERLENLIISLQSFTTVTNFKNTTDLLILTADLKLCSQLYGHLHSQFDALAQFSTGQKEKDDLKKDLEELASLLSVTKMKLETLTNSCGGISSIKINKQLQDLIIWAKQAENHITTGKKLALFPKEACIQIAEMEKFQTDIICRRSEIQKCQYIDTVGNKEDDEVVKATEDLYETISSNVCQCLQTMKDNLKERETLLGQLASMDAWLAELHNRDTFGHVENVHQVDITNLEKQLNAHKGAAIGIESQLKMVESVAESCKKISVGLSPGESRYLVNRLSGIRTEIDGLLAHEKAIIWELEELFYQWTTCDEELTSIETSLEQISNTLKKQRFPLTQESISEVGLLKHMLTEHQCQVQEMQYCKETKRSSVLDAIGELQDKCNVLSLNAIEQDKYLQLKRQMDDSRDIVNKQIMCAKDKEASLGERFRLCQNVLVELPLVKTQCQEVADQLEAIAQELYPSELNTERQRIRRSVETLVAWEHAITDDIRNLESKLLLGLRFETELPALMELLQKTKQELEKIQPVEPDEKAVDVRLQTYWLMWRNMESGMRVLDTLARKEKKNIRNYEELYSLRNEAMKECLTQMESLSHARESLKDYQWAAQGAIGFLHNAEATFLSSTGGFLDCTEEQSQLHQALEALEAGFQAHVDHLMKLVPQQPCLSRAQTEELHIQIFSQLLVGRAVLEAEAQFRLEALQRCSERQQTHRRCHEDALQCLSGFEEDLAKCAAEHVSSYEKCVARQKRAKLLAEDLQRSAGQIEELRAGCPMQGCGAGRGGEVGALWRGWAALRRGVGLLLAHTEQRAEEWKDISTSMKQCCSSLASLQTELPESSSGAGEGSLELVAQAELHQAGLEQEQRALVSLEHCLEHALSLSHSQGPTSPRPIGKTLVDIKENVRSLKERNQLELMVEAPQEKEKEKQQVIDELTELERHVLGLCPVLESCSRQSQQEYKKELSSHKAKLQHITDSVQSCYSEIPADICKHLQEVQVSLQRAEEKITKRSAHVERLAGQVEELSLGLERVKDLLKQKSSSVTEAQNALKRVWDQLDMWHGRLMLLESEVQDLAEDLPDQAHLLMDQLTEPLQCYQNTAQMVEHHTAYLSKIPACLREYEDILYRATCWLDEAESWLGASCSFTTARSLQNHANSLQLLLEDSERIRRVLMEFRPVLSDISAVCEISVQAKNLEDADRNVLTMQQTILQPLGSLLQAATVVEDLEAELRNIERDVSKIEVILSSEDNGNISLPEHLHNRQVILSNAQSMKQILRDMQRCKEELNLPWDGEERKNLVVFSKASSLLQHIEELEQLCQKQASVLENNIRKMEGIPTSKKPGDRKQQEAFVVSSSEEDEDEEDECCHSSSSDTLTSSIPEDPDETIRAADLQRDEAEQLANVKGVDGLPSALDTSLGTTESWLLSVRPWLDTSASENMESDLETLNQEPGSEETDAGDSLSHKNVTPELPIFADVSTVAKPTSVGLKRSGSQRQEDFVISSSQVKAGLEDTRLVPVRPITPFAAAAVFEEEDEHLSLLASPSQELDTLNQLKEHNENEIRLEEKHKQTLNCPKKLVRLNLQEEQPLWSQLTNQVSQKLSSLEKLQQDFQLTKGETVATGSTYAVLQQTQQAVLMLTPIVSSDGPGEQRDLFEALRQVLVSLDALTDLLLTPLTADDGVSEIKLLQNECVTGELVALTALLDQIQTVDNPDVSQCVTCLQQCLGTVQNQLQSQIGLTQQQQVVSDRLCFMDDLDLKQDRMFQCSAKAPNLKCVLVQHLRECPGERAELQQASQSLLQGISRLVELGEECTAEGQKHGVHSRSELQAALQRPERLLQVLTSQLAFAHYLFQQVALKCHEDEWVQLQVRAKALQQQALDQQVTSQRRLQEWTLWEDNCGQLGRLLDECETFLGSEEPKGSDTEELGVQRRKDGCQQILTQLDESRCTLGLFLDRGENLQAGSVRQTGGALELRWRNIYRQTEQEMKRYRDMQENWASFQTEAASLSQWLIGAKKQVQTCSDLAATSDLKQECVHSSLIKLLNFSVEFGSMSVQKVCLSRKASQLLRLREADCPGLRDQLTSLEAQWNQLTSDLSNTQEQLQQHLLKRWPPDNLLSALEDWLKTLQTQLNIEKEEIIKAKDSAYLSGCLQHFKGLKVGLTHGQLLLDFLCQSGPHLVGEDAIILRSERTMMAEKLGSLRLRWVDLQGELENQIYEAEHMHHICAQRERKLQHLRNLIDQQTKRLDQWKRPYSDFLAQRLLREWEGHLESLKDMAAVVEELKATHLNAEIPKHKSNFCFTEEVERLSRASEDLFQQMEILKPALQQTTEKWSCLKSDLNEICLYTVRLHCSLQQLRAPVFSLQQAESHLHCLQELLLTAANTEDLWDILDKSCQSLLKSIDPAMAQALNEQKERERERWKGVLQDLKVELRETEEIISTWQEFTDLSKNCSLQLQQVWSQWEKLLQMPQTHEDIQSRIHSVEELQKTVENVKQHLEDVLAASKPLNGRLDSVAYNIVQSENSQLSRDVLILSKSLEGYKKSLQEDTEKHNLLHVHLESLENQTKDIEKMDIRIKDMDSAKQVFRELSYLFSSLIDVSEASAHVNLSNHDSERLHVLRGRYMENITHSFDLYKQLHFKHHLSLDFEGKGKALADIQETLARESSLGKPVNYNSLKLMSAVHQRLQGDIVIGHKLLHGLLCDAVKVMENASDEKRSETLAQVSCIKQGWFDVLTTVNQRRSLVKQQLSRYTLYRCGLEHLCNLLRDLDPLLFSTGPVICVSQICTRDYECIEEALQAHSAVYTGTVDAGRTLCESMTNFECQKQLQTELQGLEEAWERATSLVGRQKATVQKWSQCQERIADLRSELDQCGLKLKRGPAVPKEDTEEIVQETELSLQRLRSGGQREVVSMKMDLSQYVPAGDSALLEQQLEQLHSQWEELCMKVSLRRQEIADRLNAWTIFNDKNKEFCDWLSQMENKVCHSGDLSFEEMVEKLKKDCMEEINLFSENKSHLKQLGEQLLLASDEAKQSQVHGSLQEVNQRWHNLFHHIEARVKKLKETLATVQQLDKNMSNLRSWLCRIEAELSRPITYSVLHHHEIQKRLAEHQELQRDIEQHTEGVASVLNLCDVLLRDEDASNGTEVNSDSLQETSHSLDQRWRTICALALDRRLRIEETWRLWCKFLDDYSRFEDWLKMAEQTAANPNTGDVLYTVAKEELKKFEGFQRQVHERLTQLEIVNNQYRRLARENRTDRASQLKAMVHEGNRRWDTLHRRVAAILRRLKYFTSQREDFESTRESMLVWLTELDLQLTNVEHFSESDVHHKIQQLSSFQKEITVNTERIDGLIVFGEGLIQRSSPQDAALIEEELEELHSYCQEVFGRLVRFHQRLSQPPIPVQLQIPEVSTSGFSLESSLELIGRPWLGRSLSSLPATPTHLLTSPLSRSGRETPVSVDSLPLEWDHTGDVGGSSSHEDDEDEDLDDEGAYFSAVSSRSVCDSPRWRTQDDSELVDLEPDCHAEAPPTLASTPLKQGNYLHLMSQCSGSIEDFKRVSLILDDEESPDEFGLTGLNSSGRQSGVIERWELLQAQSQTDLRDDPKEQLTCDLDNISSWLDTVIPELHRVQTSDSANTVEEMTARAKELKEMHKMFSHYKSTMLSLNLRLQGDPDSQQKLAEVNRSWSRACTELQQWDTTLRQTLMRCQEFHETLHSLLLWLAHAESRRYAVDIAQPKTTIKALKQHRNTLSDVREELLRRQTQQASLHALWSQLRPEHTEDSDEAQEKLHVTGSKMKILLREVTEDLRAIQQRLEFEPTSDEQDQSKSTVPSEEEVHAKKILPNLRGERRDSAQPRSFFYRLLRAAFPLQLLLLLLLLFPCLVPMSHSEHSCTVANNFARSFYPMLHYTNGPPPT